ncbi:hypothetical protein SARC_09231 [Sphaeroforma arctica JP610]|uniref:Hexosyltransferase n=1 Tax=Sphaeroforma arctica JP610 TaxID=667725 RepID=A0A0L0FNM4_9EUKA|nr:hypothetical protein SARC_09231 [Sphaeroforma arctica JP610]KNC78334.1 hypothetical protein SARC_09231 [Sphaeroforma arctica JP610]|eukprot:XP_014152236.1 hypothetical protein SARC_09231 [Sphaeroforma arctica JP610]
MQKFSYYHASEETSIKHEDFESAGDGLWSITPRSNHAIVALVSGDQYARLAVSLVAGLRRVNTCAGMDIVMLLSAGGLGSDECNANKGYTDKQGLVHECGSLHPVHPSQIISTVYITALQRMGVRFQFSPRVEAPMSTLKQTVWWGLAFNKVNVFGMHQYEKVVLLDTDTMVLKNLDHLTFYPMFTASTNQGCCVASEGTHMSARYGLSNQAKHSIITLRS